MQPAVSNSLPFLPSAFRTHVGIGVGRKLDTFMLTRCQKEVSKRSDRLGCAEQCLIERLASIAELGSASAYVAPLLPRPCSLLRVFK